MYDHDVFVVLQAEDHRGMASTVFKLAENAKWFHKSNTDVAQTPTLSDRESTPAIDVVDNPDRLVLTFSAIKDIRNGIQFGTDPNKSDVLLGHRGTKAISGRQYNIVVNEDLEIWLHDYHSSHGTSVRYERQKGDNIPRKRMKWIMRFAPGMKDPFGNIFIQAGRMIISLRFPHHVSANPRYLELLRQFARRHQETNEGNDLIPTIDDLGIGSALSTQAPSEAQTISEESIYYQSRPIGNGTFGSVWETIRACDGKYFASKIFRPKPMKRSFNKSKADWLLQIHLEFTHARDNPHLNIIRVHEFRETPQPIIIMDYYPDGNIQDLATIQASEIVNVFGQVLDGIHHLHSRGLVHRDIKPANLLVERKPIFRIVISDFGFTKIFGENPLKTLCGTLQYLAPEMSARQPYGPAVDVWALGTVILELAYSLLPVDKSSKSSHSRQSYQRKLLEDLANQRDDILVDILQKTLIIDPEERWRASQCLDAGFVNGLFERKDELVVAKPGSWTFPQIIKAYEGPLKQGYESRSKACTVCEEESVEVKSTSSKLIKLENTT